MPVSQRSLQNLILWQKGQSGNSQRNGGRKKGIVTLIKEALEKDEIGGVKTPDGRTIKEHYAEAIIGHGMKGNAAYMNQVMDRLEGKVGVDLNESSNKPVVYVERANNPRDRKPAVETESAPKAVGSD